jgi:hypothetical protein
MNYHCHSLIYHDKILLSQVEPTFGLAKQDRIKIKEARAARVGQRSTPAIDDGAHKTAAKHKTTRHPLTSSLPINNDGAQEHGTSRPEESRGRHSQGRHRAQLPGAMVRR